VKAAREACFEAQLDLDPDTLVFLDEMAAATSMTRRYGRAPRGERCRLLVPQGHYKTTAVTAALRTTGPCALNLADGATNGQGFRDYVANHLVPVLRPGDNVMLNNLQAHKVSGIREEVEAAGARLLYLRPYSPEFNPIDQIFAKLKTLLRSAAARTVPDLWDAGRAAIILDEGAYGEIIKVAVKRTHEPQRIVGGLLQAEISEKQAHSIHYQVCLR
jgi:transposase